MKILCVTFAAGHSYQAAERAGGLPLLRAVRPGLSYCVQLQFQPGNDSAGASHRRFTLVRGAMAREIIVGKDGKAEAFLISIRGRARKAGHAKAFMVAASACESARLLLNSRSTLFPDGLANSSGAVGRYLIDSVGRFRGGFFPSWKKCQPTITMDRRHAPVHAVVEIRPQE